MRNFRFRLARLLRVRQIQEEIARSDLAQARARARGARTSADHAASELERGRVELLRLQAGPELLASAVLARDAAQDHVARVRAACERRAQELEHDAEARRASLLEARASVRGLERLAQRRRAVHAAEQERAERLELDEVAQRRRSARLAPRASLPRAAADPAASSTSQQATDEDGVAPPSSGGPGDPR